MVMPTIGHATKNYMEIRLKNEILLKEVMNHANRNNNPGCKSVVNEKEG